MPRFLVDMGSIVHSVDAASYHIKDGFVTFENGDAVPVASFATIHVRKVEREGAVIEAAKPHPPQEPGLASGRGSGQWVTPGFGWQKPAPPSEANAVSSWPPGSQPVEAQPWERWTDVWRPAPDLATPLDLPSPVPDEHPAGQVLDAPSGGASPGPPVEAQRPSASEDVGPGSADRGAEDWASSRDANAADTGDWWIVDNPPVTEADPHQWWIVDDTPAGEPAPAAAPEEVVPGSEVSQPTGGPEEEGKPPRGPRRRRERDAQSGWASSLTAKRTRPARSGEREAPLSHQLRARRMWDTEETDPVAGEAKGASPAPEQEEVGNVLRLPVESPAEEAADGRTPEAKSHGNPFTVVSSFGSTAPETLPSETVASEAAAAQEVGPEDSGPAEPENVSPALKDLLDVAAVQAAVDAIVDAAVRGSTSGPNDDLE
ncbi:MAG: hypothetical protein QOD49_2196 [Actinomycetota bacterium]|nr:hypothetical protein [Actinomycetota bacterium]